MKKNYWLNLLITLSLLNQTILPSLAQTAGANLQDRNSYTQIEPHLTTSTIPKSTAIIITFPRNIQFDAGGSESVPIALRLVEPIMDNRGNIIAPANSPVDAVLVPREKSVQIVAQSLIIQGKIVPINAVSRTVPSVRITIKSRIEQATNYAESFGSVSSSFMSVTNGNNPDSLGETILFSQGVGALIGLLSPRYMLVTNFVEGSEYILVLEEEVALGSDRISGVASVAEIHSEKMKEKK